MPRVRPVLQHYKTTERAIEILLCCRSDGAGFSRTHAVAERLGISQHLVFKIVSRLAQAELVICQRGPSGGFHLARPAGKITVGDVVRAIDPVPVEEGELSGNRAFTEARAAFDTLLDRYTLADMRSFRQLRTPAKHL